MNLSIPPALLPMGPVIVEFFEAMLHKLNVNSHKDAIGSDDVDGLLDKMAEEIEEFREQRIRDASDPNILAELADCGNFAFLLYAYLRARGVKDVRERFIEEYFYVDPWGGKVYCRNTRSGSPLKRGDEVRGSVRNGRCYIRAQHSISGATISVARSDLVWWRHHGAWPVSKLRHKNGDTSDDRLSNLELSAMPDKQYPFVFQFRPRGKENTKNYGRYGYQRRHAFELVRVGYWDTEEEAAREGVIAWKARIKEKHGA